MKNVFTKMSRRERLYLIVGGAVLLVGFVLYPAAKKAIEFRDNQTEMLQDETALLSGLIDLDFDGSTIEEEYEVLSKGIGQANDLLFPPIENRILTQTAVMKLLNQLGPDLELETTSGRSSVSDAMNQMNFEVKGEGRYPELLKFLYRLETYQPLIIISDLSLTPKKTRRRFSRNRSTQQATEAELQLSMSLQIICKDGDK